jgi:hypothetical protein
LRLVIVIQERDGYGAGFAVNVIHLVKSEWRIVAYTPADNLVFVNLFEKDVIVIVAVAPIRAR